MISNWRSRHWSVRYWLFFICPLLTLDSKEILGLIYVRFSLRECQCTCVKTSHFCKKKEIPIFQELNLNLKNQSINDDELGFEINGIKCSSILVRANIGEIEGFMAMRKSPRVQIIFQIITYLNCLWLILWWFKILFPCRKKSWCCYVPQLLGVYLFGISWRRSTIPLPKIIPNHKKNNKYLYITLISRWSHPSPMSPLFHRNDTGSPITKTAIYSMAKNTTYTYTHPLCFNYIDILYMPTKQPLIEWMIYWASQPMKL